MQYKKHKPSFLENLVDQATRLFQFLQKGKYQYDQRLNPLGARLLYAVAIGFVMLSAIVIGFSRMGGDKPTAVVQPAEQQVLPAVDFANDYSLTEPISAWPEVGYAAVGVVGSGTLASSHPEEQSIRPMASLAKVMTTLALLEKHPIQPGEQGESLTITPNDIELYNQYIARNGSVLPVVVDQEFSIYSIVQALMIRSANNFADTAVNWAFGSVDNYLEVANQRAQDYGLKNTRFDDTTGFSPLSRSNPNDLVRLADIAMRNPVIAEVASTWTTEIDGIGSVYNTNNFLDFEGNGVVGLKTGDTDEAGGTYMVAAKRQINGETVTLLAVVLGGENHFSVQESAMPLLDDLERKLQKN